MIPIKADIIEVCPRDGFQNVQDVIPTEVKVNIILKLIKAGIKEIELTSFVNLKMVPQMWDAAEVVREITARAKSPFRKIALVPNFRGAENALKSGIKDITYVISASPQHNAANVRRTPEESIAELKKLIEAMPELHLRLAIATAFGCPYQGKVPEEDVIRLVDQALSLGVKEIILCDTIGIGTPFQVQSLGKKTLKLCGDIPASLHMHNTRGTGLANIFSGLQIGINRFETAAGGLGGCPFAPGAAGNTSTEDTINMLETMNISTGIDMETLLDAVKLIKDNINVPVTGNMYRVLREAKETCTNQ